MAQPSTTPNAPQPGAFNTPTREHISHRLNLLNAIITPITAPTISPTDLAGLSVKAKKAPLSRSGEKLAFSPALWKPQPRTALARCLAQTVADDRAHERTGCQAVGSSSSVALSHSGAGGRSPTAGERAALDLDWESDLDSDVPQVAHVEYIDDNGDDDEEDADSFSDSSSADSVPHARHIENADAIQTQQSITYRHSHLPNHLWFNADGARRTQALAFENRPEPHRGNPSACSTSQISHLDLDSVSGADSGSDEEDEFGERPVRIGDVDLPLLTLPATRRHGDVDPRAILFEHARRMHGYVGGVLDLLRPRLGSGHRGNRDRELAGVYSRWKSENKYPQLVKHTNDLPAALRLRERAIKYGWECHDVVLDEGRPDGIATVLVGSGATDDSLCLGELKAAVRLLLARYALPGFEDRLRISILLISYIGSGYGRVMQVHHDGDALVVQYSPLTAFDLDGFSSIAVFLRYLTASLAD